MKVPFSLAQVLRHFKQLTNEVFKHLPLHCFIQLLTNCDWLPTFMQHLLWVLHTVVLNLYTLITTCAMCTF